MRGLSSAVTGMFKALAILGIPKWAIVVVIAGVAWWLVPKLAHSIEMDRARRIVKGANMGDARTVAEATESAFKVAGEDPKGLVLLAEEAVRQGRDPVARQAIAHLRATGKRPKDVARLERELLGPLPATSIEAAIVVEGHIDNATWSHAREKITRFRNRWPNDPELAALAERLEREAPSVATPTVELPAAESAAEGRASRA